MFEKLSNLNIAITSTTSGGEEHIGRIAYLSRSFELFQGIEQSVGSVPENLQIVPSAQSFIYINNLGSTNVTVDSVVAMDAFPQRIAPGRSICLFPQINVIWVKAAGQGTIWVMSVY